tara:strand:- start:2943 stop:3149 length:207 start_codon:yes stop_codon:yes gene_type:complete
MATYDMRATQKIYRPKSTSNRDIDALKQRMQSVETALNLILQKLDNNDQGKVEQEKQLELPNFKYPAL